MCANEDHPLDIGAENSMYGVKCLRKKFQTLLNINALIRPYCARVIFTDQAITPDGCFCADRIYNDVPILAPGEQTDFLFNAVYVNDLARQICLTLLNEKFYGGIFNTLIKRFNNIFRIFEISRLRSKQRSQINVDPQKRL